MIRYAIIMSAVLAFILLVDMPMVYGNHQDQPAPTNIITASGDGQVTLTWDHAPDTNFCLPFDWSIKYRITGSSDVFALFNDGVSTSQTATVTGLTNGVSYDFRIAAINIQNNGALPSGCTVVAEETTTSNNFGTATATPAAQITRTIADSVTASDTTSRVVMFVRTLTDSVTISGAAIGGTSCSPPVSGDWTITSSCILASSATAPANVIVQNNSVLTIPNGVSLNIDFATNHLLVKSGSGVLIKAGGKIF